MDNEIKERIIKPQKVISAEMPVTSSTRKEDVLDQIANPMARKLSEEIENNIVNDIASSEMTCKTGYYRVSVYYAVEIEDLSQSHERSFNIE